MANTTPTNIGGHSTKERVSVSRGAWRLLTFVAFVFGVFLVSYFGLALGYGPFLRAQIDATDEKLNELARQVPKDQQDAYVQFQYQLRNLQSILANHVIATKIFATLESGINQRVFYRGISINTETLEARFQAVAPTYDIMAQQLAAYAGNPDIERFQVTRGRTTEGNRVEFEVTLFLKPNVFEL
jgi:hypothetical protein